MIAPTRAVRAALFLIVVSGIGVFCHLMHGVGEVKTKLCCVFSSCDNVAIIDLSYNPEVDCGVIEISLSDEVGHDAVQFQKRALLSDIWRQIYAVDFQRSSACNNIERLAFLLWQDYIVSAEVKIGIEWARQEGTGALGVATIYMRNSSANIGERSHSDDICCDLAVINKTEVPMKRIAAISPFARGMGYRLKYEYWSIFFYLKPPYLGFFTIDWSGLRNVLLKIPCYKEEDKHNSGKPGPYGETLISTVPSVQREASQYETGNIGNPTANKVGKTHDDNLVALLVLLSLASGFGIGIFVGMLTAFKSRP